MNYPDGMTTAAFNRHNGTDTDTREADYQTAKQARALLCAALWGLQAMEEARDTVLAWAITDAMAALEKSVDQINGAEPECEA